MICIIGVGEGDGVHNAKRYTANQYAKIMVCTWGTSAEIFWKEDYGKRDIEHMTPLEIEQVEGYIKQQAERVRKLLQPGGSDE